MIVKTYLTRSQSRAWSVEHPFGDPTGGAAYREMRGPAVAVIGMATSFSGMAAGSIMAGLAFAGSALSLVGTLTGNKTLSTIGMIAGGIGGAGMAGAFGEAVKGATWGGTFGGTAGVADASMATANLSQSAAPAAGNLAPVTDGVQAMPVAAPRQIPAQPLASGPGSVAATAAPASLNAPGGSTGINAPGDSSIASLSMSPGASEGGLISGQMGGTAAPPANVPGTGITDGIAGAGKSAVGFIKDNPELAKIMAQGASGLADYLSGVPDAQLAALEAQTGYADARAMQIQDEITREKDRRSRLNAGYQHVDQSIRVNPNVNMTQNQPRIVPGGLIAGAQAQ